VSDKSDLPSIHGFTVEGLKSYFEFFKHMTTMNTGSILLLVAFMDKLFRNPQWKFLVGICISSFILSLIACLSGMWFVSTMIAGQGSKTNVSFVSWLVAVGAFLAGIIVLAVFSLRNL